MSIHDETWDKEPKLVNSDLDDKKEELKNLRKIIEFLNDIEQTDWKNTLDDDFWLEKFKKDHPEDHIHDKR